MRKIIEGILCLFLFNVNTLAQNKTVSSDKNWDKSLEVLKNGYEAEYIIRIGDIDNLNFGFPEDFDPFCGKLTDAHSYPWEAQNNDLAFMDRILVSSKGVDNNPCGSDGYSVATELLTKGVARFSLPTESIKAIEIKNAFLQLFIDDFQAPVFCSKFKITLNDKIFVEAEKILNAVNQTGPVGKLVTIPIPQEFWEYLNQGQPLRLAIDEVTGTADGYAIDFIRLLVNRQRENSCRGNIKGIVLDKASNQPIQKVKVSSTDGMISETDTEGRFSFSKLPTGYEPLVAAADGYADGRAMADVGEGDDNQEVIIYLEKGQKKLQFDNKSIAVGEAIQLNNILFDAAKADLRPESKIELDKLVQFLTQNVSAEIELSGHTSSEGGADLNRNLSYRRVKSCRDYVVSKGIEASRISIIGYGADRPIAPNDSEGNRAKNRRVEMRIIKL